MQGFQAEGGTAIIKTRSSVNGREGGVGMKRKKGNMVQDDKTRSGWRDSSKRVVVGSSKAKRPDP